MNTWEKWHPWERWQRELLYKLKNIATYSNLGLDFTLDLNEQINIDHKEKDLHLSIKEIVYKKYYNSISPPRWNWEDSLSAGVNNLMEYINEWLKRRGVL